MYGAIKQGRAAKWKTHLAASSVLLSVILLGGCSSVSGAYNSVAGWMSPSAEDDQPLNGRGKSASGNTAAAPSATPQTADAAKPEKDSSSWWSSLFSWGDDEDADSDDGASGNKVATGLNADRGNSHYTDGSSRREGNATRPLNPEIAQAKPVAPPPVVTTEAAPPPANLPVMQAATPAPHYAATPAPAPSSSLPTMRAPAAQANESVDEVYKRRLAEFNAPLPPSYNYRASMVSTPAPAYTQPMPYAASAAYGQTGTAVAMNGAAAPVQLNRPLYNVPAKGRNASGARALSDFVDGSSAASFDVASLSFGEGTAELSSTGRAQLREVASLFKQKGGSLRVIGHSASPRLDVDPTANREANAQLARQRADAVAAELIRMGVSARKIYAGAETAYQTAAADSTDIVLDY